MDKIKIEIGWEYACMTCNGKGYEEKLSCGCTGYQMRRYCLPCKGTGTVDLLTHDIQAKEHIKKWNEILKITG